jgi:hypothetical protein
MGFGFMAEPKWAISQVALIIWSAQRLVMLSAVRFPPKNSCPAGVESARNGIEAIRSVDRQ